MRMMRGIGGAAHHGPGPSWWRGGRQAALLGQGPTRGRLAQANERAGVLVVPTQGRGRARRRRRATGGGWQTGARAAAAGGSGPGGPQMGFPGPRRLQAGGGQVAAPDWLWGRVDVAGRREGMSGGARRKRTRVLDPKFWRGGLIYR